jgi:hypothetical protein
LKARDRAAGQESTLFWLLPGIFYGVPPTKESNVEDAPVAALELG